MMIVKGIDYVLPPMGKDQSKSKLVAMSAHASTKNKTIGD